MSKDFLIITPLRAFSGYFIPALGPIALYSYAKKNGFNGDLLDFNTKINQDNIDEYDEIIYNELAQWIKNNPAAKCIGISILFSGIFPRALSLAKTIKKISPTIKVVIGGIHPTIHSQEILENCKEIDYIVIGEGEQQFVNLLNKIYFNENALLNDGIAYRENNKIILKPKTNYTNRETIKTLGALDYSPLDFDKYHSDEMESWHNPRQKPIKCAVPIIASRSCPHNCTFCCIHSMFGPSNTYRYRDPKHVLDEIKYLYYEKDIHYLQVIDDCSTCNKRYALQLFEKIAQSEMKLSLDFVNGLNIMSLDDTMMDTIAAAGMMRGGLAIESGSDYLRNTIINKKLPREKILSVCKRFKEKHPHVFINAFFILGLPEETEETLEETVKLIEELDTVYPILNIAAPFPGSHLWEQCVKDDLLLFDHSDIWKKSLVVGQKEWSNTTSWTMKGLTPITSSFCIKPYNLSLEILSEYHKKLQDVATSRLHKIKHFLKDHQSLT